MDRLSRASLWTLIGAALTASGCADVLGFKEFADDADGGASNGAITSQGQNNSTGDGTSNPGGGANNQVGGGSTGTSGTSSPGGGATNPAGGGSTGSTSGSSDQSAGSGTGVSTGNSTGGSTGSQSGSTGAGNSSQTMSSAASSTENTGTGGASSSKTSTGASSSSTGTATSSSSSRTTSAASSSMTTSAASSSVTTSGGAGPCSYGNAFNGDGSFTFYFFGQGGTAQTSAGNFKTACGYAGTEASGGGLSGQAGSVVDTVPNAANSSPAKDTYFAAIPNTSGTTFDTVNFCGACVEITNGGTSVVATVVDECPVGSNPKCVSGHLDLSTQVFDALNYPNGDPSGTTWKFVPCPEGTKNIQAVENASGEYYLQSSVYPIGTVGGQSIQTSGFFMINPGTYEVTSPYTSQTIMITIPNGGGDTGANFTAPSNCF